MNAARTRTDAPRGHSSKSARDHELCAAFGRRLRSALDNNPNAPPHNYGRLPWLLKKFEERGITLTRQSLSKWANGEVMPLPERIEALADIIGVDAGWLSMGDETGVITQFSKAAHNAMAAGAVNLVAGLIQSAGGTVAFPSETDGPAVDLHAIIRGARYTFNIAQGEQVADGYEFPVPVAKDVVVLGLVWRDGFAFEIYEITDEVIEARSRKARSGLRVTVPDLAEMRRITTFVERI